MSGLTAPAQWGLQRIPGVAADNGLNSQCEMTPHNTPLSCHTTNHQSILDLLSKNSQALVQSPNQVPTKVQCVHVHMCTKVKSKILTKNLDTFNFKGYEWEKMFQGQAPSTTECQGQGAVPMSNFHWGLYCLVRARFVNVTVILRLGQIECKSGFLLNS